MALMAPDEPRRAPPAVPLGGLHRLESPELLAMLLGGAGAVAIARGLIDQLGISGLANARPDELAASPGVTLRRAQRVAAAVELGKRVLAAQPDRPWLIRGPADIAERLLPQMAYLEREELRVCLLNTRHRVIGEETVYVGNLAGSPVRVGEVFREAVRRQAAAIVVIHNHPSGDPAPSGDDLRITADLAEAGRLLDIDLLDHLVIGASGWVSLRATGAFEPRQSAITTRDSLPFRATT
jgi:DNA repair protein RadC